MSYLDMLTKTGGERIEATLRWRRILFAGFVARMEDTRLPKCVMFIEMVGGAGCGGGREKECMGCFLDDLRASGINADHWTPGGLSLFYESFPNEDATSASRSLQESFKKPPWGWVRPSRSLRSPRSPHEAPVKSPRILRDGATASPLFM